MIQVIKYTDNWKQKWDTFIEESRTNSFMHYRSYMEYHKDRFQDSSLLILKDQQIVALLPANFDKDKNIVSHGGLTFGGLVIKAKDKPINTLIYLRAILHFLHEQGVNKMYYKQPPMFYNTCSQDETEYAIFLVNGNLVRIDTTFAIDNFHQPINFQERRRRAIKKAEKLGVEIKESTSFQDFWNEILVPNLSERFGVKPVHSLDEITYLSKNNPNKIRQFNAYLNGEIFAGATIFETPLVAHAQYISAKIEGRKNGSIDLLFNKLINVIFSDKKYFDFGIVNENEGRTINRGLWDWKEGFGAKVFAHRFYEIETKNYSKINVE